MKIALVHPYRHHSYYTLKGIQMYSTNFNAYYGYYNKNDFIDRLLKKTSIGPKLLGYSTQLIEESHIKVNYFRKLDFLYAKKNENYTERYINNFQKWVISQLKNIDTLHVLQDYCNDVIRFAYKNGVNIIYEQIQPFDYAQKEYLIEEVKEEKYPLTYVNNRFPNWKIEKQLENLEMSKAIISASQATTISLKPYTNKKVYTFPYGAKDKVIEKNELEKLLNRRLHSKRIKILYIGAINLIKGVRYIIEVARKMVNEPVDFTFIGKPSFPEDLKLIEQIKSLSNCTYIESIPHIQINEIYQNNDIFVFQGLCEGFGMVTLEAMSNAMPCIVSEGACGVISNGIDGFINKNRDVNAIVNYIRMLCEDRELLVKLSFNAQNNIRNFTWDRFSNEIYKVYKSEFGVKR